MNKKQFLWICFLIALAVCVPPTVFHFCNGDKLAVGWLAVWGGLGIIFGIIGLVMGAMRVYDILEKS